VEAYVLDWLQLVVRWFHLTAGIAWIGASFYFVWLDDNLNRRLSPGDERRGMFGDLWAVHGGGFYHNQKYLTGPVGEPLTTDLHWFKWEAYSTWLSGVAMLALVYWAGASTFLIDKSVLDLTVPEAIAISIASLVVGWLIYDGLCRLLERRPAALWTAIAVTLLIEDYVLFHVFGPRAAFIHVGSIIGTIMVANVFFIVIPGQQRMLAQIRAGETPDPRPGMLGKMRSVHNTYLTLPVLFIMISNHYPMTYEGPYGWLVLAGISLAGVLVRRFFILTHAQRYAVGLPVAAAVALAVVAYAIAPRATPAAAGGPPVAFADVAPIFATRCAVCHAAHPTYVGFTTAPEGVLLDTPANIAANAARVGLQAVTTHAMPLGNVTGMTDAERTRVGAWIDHGAPLQ
jgi:uncharacterized membrane protein